MIGTGYRHLGREIARKQRRNQHSLLGRDLLHAWPRVAPSIIMNLTPSSLISLVAPVRALPASRSSSYATNSTLYLSSPTLMPLPHWSSQPRSCSHQVQACPKRRLHRSMGPGTRFSQPSRQRGPRRIFPRTQRERRVAVVCRKRRRLILCDSKLFDTGSSLVCMIPCLAATLRPASPRSIHLI